MNKIATTLIATIALVAGILLGTVTPVANAYRDPTLPQLRCKVIKTTYHAKTRHIRRPNGHHALQVRWQERMYVACQRPDGSYGALTVRRYHGKWTTLILY